MSANQPFAQPYLVRPKDVAAAFGISKTGVCRLPLRRVRIGACVRFFTSEVQQYLEDRTAPDEVWSPPRSHVAREARRLMAEDKQRVYFIQCGKKTGPIKIGISADPVKRLEDLQTANPYPLRLIATMPGGTLMEEALHLRFAKSRLQREWFRCTAELLAFIVQVTS